MAGNPQTEDFIDGTTVTVESGVDYHLTNTDPLRNGATVDLKAADSWLILENVRPSVAIEKYLSSVKVNGAAFEQGKNGRVGIYSQGVVLMPEAENPQPLQVWTGENYSGESRTFDLFKIYNTDGAEVEEGKVVIEKLDGFDNSIKSFKLKRGYMATFANEANGQGYSRVFIASDADIEVPVLQSELNGKISYVRCFRWNYVSKKGWCSSGSNWQNEVELTQSTSYYSWSADKQTLANSEYVPIKQNYGWPDFNQIESKENITHLLGFNEPDRPEQANATVERAISQWPQMMKSGLRLGTPAIADNLTWLYNFMDECKARNYRVDFVAVHAYWGGSGGAQNVYQNGEMSIERWKSILTTIHERTGLPIWITEWNNGANWTNETWPDGKNVRGDQNFQKQKEDLEKIIAFFDETPWIERYFIYNWVGDCRAIVEGQDDSGNWSAGGANNQRLTPAGEFYASNPSEMAFSKAEEVAPTWDFLAPSVSASLDLGSKSVNVSWNDYNGEVTDSYVVERKAGDGEWTELATGAGVLNGSLNDATIAIQKSTRYTYRVRIKLGDTEQVSNEVPVDVPVMQGSGDIRFEKASLADLEWKYVFFDEANPFAEAPIVVFGGFDNSVRSLLTSAIKSVQADNFRFQIQPWEYQDVTSLVSNVNASLLAVKAGNLTVGTLPAEAGKATRVSGDWKDVTFEKPFDDVPVVFVNPTTGYSTFPVVARVRNVTKDGFQVRLTREKGITDSYKNETISYFAIAKGETTVDGKKLLVGSTQEVVGELSKKADLEFGSTFENPIFYAALQTSADDFTCNIRYSGLTSEGVTVFKQREKSAGASGSSEVDAVGYLVVSGDAAGVESAISESDDFKVYPTIVRDGVLHLEAQSGDSFAIYSASGLLVKHIEAATSINVGDLQSGIYFIRNAAGKVQRFVVAQ